jgi:hypothetical protein
VSPRTLNTPKVNTANVCAVVEAKDGTCLIERDVFGQADDISVEGAADIIELTDPHVVSP